MRFGVVLGLVVCCVVGIAISDASASIDADDIFFLRGDANNDSVVNGSDASFISDFLMGNGPTPLCMDAADANDDGAVTSDDATYIVTWYYSGGNPPPSPGPFTCGEDPTDSDGLGCGDHACND